MKNIHIVIPQDTVNFVALVQTNQPLPTNPYFRKDLVANDEWCRIITERSNRTYNKGGGVWVYSDSTVVELADQGYADVFADFDPSTIDLSVEIDKANNRLLKKLKSTSVSIIMAFRERKETAKLVYTFAESLKKLWVYKSNPVKAAQAIFGNYRSRERQIAFRAHRSYLNRIRRLDETFRMDELYLCYRYGLQPLVADIKEACKAISEACERYRCDQKASGFNKAITFDQWNAGRYFGYVGGFGTIHHWSHIGQAYGMLKYRIGAKYSVDSDLERAASAFADIPTTLWDGVPFSFLIDNVINVSKYLDLRNATLGLVFEDGYQSFDLKMTAYANPAPPVRLYRAADNYVYNISSDGDQLSGTYHTFSRQRRIDFPYPQLEFPFEALISKNLGLSLDILALVRNRIRQ